MAALKKQSKVLVGDAVVANTFFSRFLGLMGRKAIAVGDALVFPRCNSIHTFFMRFAIDVVFVSKEGRVVSVLPALKPWRMLLPIPKAKHAIEMASGEAARHGIALGDILECEGIF